MWTRNWKLETRKPAPPISMLVRRRLAQINAGEQNKNVSLDQSYENVKSHEDDGDKQWNQREENQRNHFSRKHVGEKTNGQRHDPGQMAADLDKKHEGGQPPDGSQKMLEVTQHAVLTYAL